MENYRLIMEHHLGRKLLSSEIVHHEDGDSNNNSLDNLEIVTQSEHRNKQHPDGKHWDGIIKNKLNDRMIETILAKDFNDSLNVFFSPRKKDIIFKKIYSEKLSKTEKEYYSRSIKKKLCALLNPTLQRIASLLVRK